RGGVAGLNDLLDERPELDLVVVGSLASFATGSRALDEEMATAVRELKALAVERETVVLVTAPLPHLATRADRRPVLEDFGGLGTVKQQADVVLALFREGMYQPSRDVEGATELLVRKNRNGGTGYVDLYFYAQWMRF